jgi:hypothetical protein
MMSETTSSEHQRWLDAAAEYVGLRDQAIALQAQIDVRRQILEASVRSDLRRRAFLVPDHSAVVLIVQNSAGEIAIQTRTVIK